MNSVLRAVLAGAVGAAVTTVLHEIIRRTTPDAPRLDLLGMNALAKTMRGVGAEVPSDSSLYASTLAGDLVSNAAYYSLVGLGSGKSALAIGAVIGTAAGVGAVYLPPVLGLRAGMTDRTVKTEAITIGLYAAGGMAAAAAYGAFED